ncbi:MAG TPA: SDR family oxidoreductase [Chitinophagaceae bacterium]|nr:SDR family oxidoreductase [Chitinophagaceae bacterium]
MKVLITGASRGIGKALAEIFAANGHSLLLISKNEVSLYKTLEELCTKFPETTINAKAFDLSLKEEAIKAGNWVLDKFDAPEIIINNAGIFAPGNVTDEPDGNLEMQMATNLYSAYHLNRAILPAMIKQNKTINRHIFNICSIASLKAYKNGGAYSISKFALHGFSQNLREELKPHHIKVTSVFPGAVMTDSWSGFDNRDNRIMEASDVAKMIYTATQLSPAACVEDIVMRPVLGDL